MRNAEGRAGGMKKNMAAFAVGAAGYPCLELIARGRTHWSMALLGGVCVLALMWIARRFPAMPLAGQAALGAAFITAAEFAVGMVVNLWLGWDVWDYSHEFADVLGQICPLFSFLWFLLCLPVLAAVRRYARVHPADRRGGRVFCPPRRPGAGTQPPSS